MKILYLDCFSGISGDMLLGSLIDLGLDLKEIKKELDKLHIKYELNVRKVKKNNISATKIDVISGEKEKHRNLKDIYELIDNTNLNDEIKVNGKKIFLKLAEAESKIHNTTIYDIHFHEVGAVDSIVDIMGCLICLKKLNIKKIYSSHPVLGKGFVKCHHGIIPIPSPATLEILKGIKTKSNGINNEMTTPTGAVLLSCLVNEFGNMPEIKIEKIGYGAGKAELTIPNVLRIILGDLNEQYDKDCVKIIETNIDDMNPENYDFVMKKLFENGALDVYFTNIQMKKNRPAIKLTVISKENDVNKFVDLIFNNTTTFGIRIYDAERKKLSYEKKIITTKYGNISVKIGKTKDNHIKTISPEYEDCRKIAEKNNLSLKYIYESTKSVFYSNSKDK